MIKEHRPTKWDIKVAEFLAAFPGGAATTREISEATGASAATIRRIRSRFLGRVEKFHGGAMLACSPERLPEANSDSHHFVRDPASGFISLLPRPICLCGRRANV